MPLGNGFARFGVQLMQVARIAKEALANRGRPRRLRKRCRLGDAEREMAA
jgi:hypothetical protein